MSATGDAALLLQAFDVLGGDAEVAYLSTPITSGRRELRLLRRLGVGPEELRRAHRDAWRREVVRPNEDDAELHVEIARKRLAPQLVVNPARLRHESWTQEEYTDFWVDLLGDRASRVVLAPDWAYSRGARVEVGVALRLGIPMEDVPGRPVTAADVAAADRAARDELAADGWDAAAVDAYLPPLHVAAAAGHPAAPTALADGRPLDRAAAGAFTWLLGERSYQVRKFGTELDDRHTVDGLGEDAWWWRQLASYFHRARVLGLDNPVGRQALAKFTATAVGLLESAVRVHGELPPPGVPSGDLGPHRADHGGP